MRKGDNKVEIVQFLFNDWSHNKRYRELLSDLTVFVNIGKNFHKIHVLSNLIETALDEDLNTTYEETDTKVFLYTLVKTGLIPYIQLTATLHCTHYISKRRLGFPFTFKLAVRSRKGY